MGTRGLCHSDSEIESEPTREVALPSPKCNTSTYVLAKSSQEQVWRTSANMFCKVDFPEIVCRGDPNLFKNGRLTLPARVERSPLDFSLPSYAVHAG